MAADDLVTCHGHGIVYRMIHVFHEEFFQQKAPLQCKKLEEM